MLELHYHASVPSFSETVFLEAPTPVPAAHLLPLPLSTEELDQEDLKPRAPRAILSPFPTVFWLCEAVPME